MNTDNLMMTVTIADLPEVRQMLTKTVLEVAGAAYVAGAASAGRQTDAVVLADAERHAHIYADTLNAAFDRICAEPD